MGAGARGCSGCCQACAGPPAAPSATSPSPACAAARPAASRHTVDANTRRAKATRNRNSRECPSPPLIIPPSPRADLLDRLGWMDAMAGLFGRGAVVRGIGRDFMEFWGTTRQEWGRGRAQCFQSSTIRCPMRRHDMQQTSS